MNHLYIQRPEAARSADANINVFTTTTANGGGCGFKWRLLYTLGSPDAAGHFFPSYPYDRGAHRKEAEVSSAQALRFHLSSHAGRRVEIPFSRDLQSPDVREVVQLPHKA